MQQEIAVINPIIDYQDSQIHKNLIIEVRSNLNKHVIEKEDDIPSIGKMLYRVYNPRSAVSVRKVYKRKLFSAKA